MAGGCLSIYILIKLVGNVIYFLCELGQCIVIWTMD